MDESPAGHRFYGELAVWWPLISPPEEYEAEAGFAATILRSASVPVREVLELGSGGGHNAVHLKAGVRHDARRSLRGDARRVAAAQPRV